MPDKRRAVNALRGEFFRDRIWKGLPTYAAPHMAATFKGHDPDAALSLIAAAPNEWRGLIALCAYWIGMPNPAYRNIVNAVWDHDHEILLSDAKRHQVKVRNLIAAGCFQIPFRGLLKMYRGVAGLSPIRASKGLSWTTSYDVACWFAYRGIWHGKADPLVLKAKVDSSDMIFWCNERDEKEVILRHAPTFDIHPNPSDWERRAERLELARKAETAARLEGLRRRNGSG